jgi:hypothetical protein
MGIRERAIADAKKITSNKTSGAGVDLRIVSRITGQEVNLIGLHTRHHLSVSSEGNFTNDLNAHCTFAESLLSGYPVRNNKNLVSIVGDFVYATDSEGIERKYKIALVHPDETMGLIRCILEDCG